MDGLCRNLTYGRVDNRRLFFIFEQRAVPDTDGVELLKALREEPRDYKDDKATLGELMKLKSSAAVRRPQDALPIPDLMFPFRRTGPLPDIAALAQGIRAVSAG